MLEYLTSREKSQFECAECAETDYRTLHWRVNKWLCENCKAKQKHSLAAGELLATSSKRDTQIKEL